jgi:hypoxanthine-DNA glycosylase
MRIETHPFGAFLPDDVEYLIVGTFPGKQFSQLSAEEVWADEMAWSYGGRNQFWAIMEQLYGVTLTTRAEKQDLFRSLHIGMMDLILSCSRKNDSNLDNNLENITWNTAAFEKLLIEKEIKKIFCTGKGVAVILKKWFPNWTEKIIALPSPSPRFANKSITEKTNWYKMVFPNTL